MANIFLCWKTYLFCIIKDIAYHFIRDMFKIIIQSLKVQISYNKTHRIRDIILKSISSHNLDITPKVQSS